MLKEHREFMAATRAKMNAAASGTPQRASRRPFVGEVSRSELECWFCVSNNVNAEDSALLHHDPEFAVPVTTLEQAAAAEQAEHAERHRHGNHGLAVR